MIKQIMFEKNIALQVGKKFEYLKFLFLDFKNLTLFINYERFFLKKV